jgi:hypothetical protein
LISAIVSATPTIGSGQPPPRAADPMSQNTYDSRKLEIGPAIAIRNSDFGLGGSFSISATPPKLVKDDREEHADGDGDAHPGVGGACEVGVLLREQAGAE